MTPTPCNENIFYPTSPVPPNKDSTSRIEIKNRKQILRQGHFSVKKQRRQQGVEDDEFSSLDMSFKLYCIDFRTLFSSYN